MLGISFAPRIKNFEKQYLYSFNKPYIVKNFDYKILSKKKINIKIIESQWNEILRLIVTIKLKKTSASQILQRLSSYSRQHPTYKAIKEFGRIIKSLFLLKYIDDVNFRHSIQKQLNKLENSNKFSKAVFYGNNQEFQYSTKEEQLAAESCKRLIQNSIICWNYMYLSQKIYNINSEIEKETLIKNIKKNSIVVWNHINLHGEYDFSEKVLQNSIDFNLYEMFNVEN